MAVDQIPSNNAFAWRPFIRQWGMLLVPLFYLAIVFWLQPPERLGEPEKAPWLGRWFYDDYDPAAYALRGLNAALGRKPGRQQEPATLSPEDFCGALDSGLQECDSTTPYFLEYPHAVLLLFRLGYVAGNDLKETTVPEAVCNARQHNLVVHLPRTDAERNLWRHLRRAMEVYAAVTTACLIGLMLTLKRGYQRGTDLSGPVELLLLPAALYFTVSRFDIVPALLSALSLACLGRRQLIASAVFLGAATMVKVYPLVFAPLVVRYLWAERKDALVWAGAYAATVAAMLLPPVALYGWDATWAPYGFQLSRSRSEGWTLYGYVLPRFLGNDPRLGGLFRMGTMLLTELVLLWSRPRDLSGLLRRAALILIVFVSLQVFYSPQWILWLCPLLIPLAGPRRSVLGLIVLLDVVTYLTFPVVFDLPYKPVQRVLSTFLVFARFGGSAALAITLWSDEFAKASQAENPGPAPS